MEGLSFSLAFIYIFLFCSLTPSPDPHKPPSTVRYIFHISFPRLFNSCNSSVNIESRGTNAPELPRMLNLYCNSVIKSVYSLGELISKIMFSIMFHMLDVKPEGISQTSRNISDIYGSVRSPQCLLHSLWI
jgi:hypothetical protein